VEAQGGTQAAREAPALDRPTCHDGVHAFRYRRFRRATFTAAGFRIAAIDEPLPAPATPRELLPDFLKDKPPGSGFMFFVLEAD
jgi:hypothetical protein